MAGHVGYVHQVIVVGMADQDGSGGRELGGERLGPLLPGLDLAEEHLQWAGIAEEWIGEDGFLASLEEKAATAEVGDFDIVVARDLFLPVEDLVGPEPLQRARASSEEEQ